MDTVGQSSSPRPGGGHGTEAWSGGELVAGGLVLVLLALATSAQGFVAFEGMGADVAYTDLLLRHGAMWSFWGAAGLLLVPAWGWTGSRLPAAAHLGVHVLGSAAASFLSWWLLHFLASDLVSPVLGARAAPGTPPPKLPPVILPGLSVYWIICGLASLRAARRGLAAERLEAHLVAKRNAELEASLQAARFDLLQRQVQPHFLFNALNTVACLAEEGEGARTKEVVLSLAGVLRSTIDAADSGAVPLADEVRLARQYLDVQRARFGDRLDVRWDLEPEAMTLDLPPLLLITLVENVVEHALARSTRGTRLEIVARAEGERVSLTVRDDGPGFPEDVLEGRAAGTGLASSRARLEHLHGTRQSMRLANRATGGAEVVVEVAA